jgi:hypothetical protein
MCAFYLDKLTEAAIRFSVHAERLAMLTGNDNSTQFLAVLTESKKAKADCAGFRAALRAHRLELNPPLPAPPIVAGRQA